MEHKYKLLIFDFDGTLQDNFEYIVSEYNKIAEKKKFNKIDSPEEIEKIRNFKVMGNRKELKIPLRKVPRLISKIRKALRNTTKEMLIKDIDNILKTLSSKYELQILSTNKSNIILKVLEEHKLLKYFKSVNVASVYRGKTSKLRSIIKKSGLSNEEILYIGDEISDAVSCKKSSIEMLGVSWGVNSESALLNAGVIDVIDTPDELLTIL